MSAVAELLTAVRVAGGEVQARGGKIRVTAPAPLPGALMDELRRHRDEMLVALGTSGAEPAWDRQDWQALYHERAAIAEHDGSMTRGEAEKLAFEGCVVEWLNKTSEASPPGLCAWCGDGQSGGSVVLPFGNDMHGHTWLHSGCWEPWQGRRRQRAIVELARFGIAPPHGEFENNQQAGPF